ncbi:MAG: prepilin-type N-terminal cleavage/methylation domain-containing protein [Gallionella sp.]
MVRPVSSSGFTLIELVMTLVIIGILAAVAAPKFFSNSVFQSRGFADELSATLRYAQKLAMVQNRFVCVGIDADRVTLTYDATAPGIAHATATCPGSNLTSPAGLAPYTVTAPDGITLSGVKSFSFDKSGRPGFAATQRIAVSGYAIPVTVEAETGYVH